MPMTNAEVKVKELSEKLLDIIACNRNANASPETTLKTSRHILAEYVMALI